MLNKQYLKDYTPLSFEVKILDLAFILLNR